MDSLFASRPMAKRIGCAFTATLLVASFSCRHSSEHRVPATTANFAGPTASQSVEVLTFQTEKGWGYTISLNGRRFIYQPTIPAVGNNQSFDTEMKAQKTGQLVAYKIQHHLSPPAVSRAELDSLGVFGETDDSKKK